jgi:hypothetical protein
MKMLRKTRDTDLKRIERDDPTLKEVIISTQYPTQYIEKLKNNHHVTRVTVTIHMYDAVKDLLIEMIAQLLEVNKSITYLCIDGVPIIPATAKLLSNSIEKNTTLKELVLIRNFVTSHQTECVKSIISGLARNSTLTSLSLENGIGVTGAKAMIEVLEYNFTLTNFKIPNTSNIGKELHESINALLRRNQELAIKKAQIKNKILEDSFEEDGGIGITEVGNSDNDEPTLSKQKKRNRKIVEEEENNLTTKSSLPQHKAKKHKAETSQEDNGPSENSLTFNEQNKKENKQKSSRSKLLEVESNIENEINEMSDIDDEMLAPDKEYRQVKKTKQLDDEEKIKRGRLGEERANIYFFNKYKNKYKNEPEKTIKGFKITGVNRKNEKKEIEYIWKNVERDTTAPIDAIITTKRDGKEDKKRYVEVKATGEKKPSKAKITRNQLKAMKKHGNKFTLFRVYDVYDKKVNDRVQDKEIKDPYKKLLLEPTLSELIQSIELKI